MFFQQTRWVCGYALMLVPPVLLLLGIEVDRPEIVFAFTMLLLPLARVVFGAFRRSEPIQWRESAATVLDALPLAYLAVLLIGLTFAVFAAGRPSVSRLALGLSLWAVLLFGTCIAHELLHRRGRRDVIAGAVLSGLTGYPMLAVEHLRHHAKFGDTESAEWPRVHQSAWRFALRRLRAVLAGNTWDRLSTSERVQYAVAVGATASLAIAFGWAGGWPGAFLYLTVAFGVSLGVQLITYIQHWGLGDDSVGPVTERQLAWEDDCLLQAFLTLHISFHQAHHDTARVPYYRLPPAAGSPRLPAGYIVLLVLCLIPPLWHRAMRPVLDAWKLDPSINRSTGRRLTCFALYDFGRGPGKR